MDVATLRKQIEGLVSILLKLARELTYNKISDNCRFILSEIKDSEENAHIERKLRKGENDKKVPVTLDELMPALLSLSDNFYDINLHVYKAEKNITIIDFRYYPKSSLDEEYRQKVLYNPPMLHCKVSTPFWLPLDNKKKFDINWEHYEGLIWLRLLWLKLKLKVAKRYSFILI